MYYSYYRPKVEGQGGSAVEGLTHRMLAAPCQTLLFLYGAHYVRAKLCSGQKRGECSTLALGRTLSPELKKVCLYPMGCKTFRSSQSP